MATILDDGDPLEPQKVSWVRVEPAKLSLGTRAAGYFVTAVDLCASWLACWRWWRNNPALATTMVKA